MTELPVLNAAAARGLDAITRATLLAGFEALKLTYLSRSWQHLGFGTFEEWAAAMPKYQLSRDERRAVVLELDGIGMTQRQIAAAVGMGETTVRRDLAPNGGSDQPAPTQTAPGLAPNGAAEPESEGLGFDEVASSL